MRKLFCEICRCPGATDPTVKHDKEGSIALVEGAFESLKQVELRNFFTQHKIAIGEITVKYVASDENVADGMT